MIYLFTDYLHPIILILLICPLLALLLGMICSRLGLRLIWCVAGAALLPLLFLAKDLQTIAEYWWVWLLSGGMYVLKALTAFKMTTERTARRQTDNTDFPLVRK